MKRAFAAGTLLTAALFALLSYMRDTVKTEKQAAAKLDAPLFAAVYHESRYKNLKSRLLREKEGKSGSRSLPSVLDLRRPCGRYAPSFCTSTRKTEERSWQ